MHLNLKRQILNKKNLSVIPEEPGIYIFSSEHVPLYVGKSVNLRSRVKSYLNNPLYNKTAKMISLAGYFSYIVVTSELEALLLEAKLVNLLQTPYNIQLKDDKHPLYIRITKNKYPMVLTARKINQNDPNLAFFGPFPSSVNVKKTLTLIRKIFPFAQHLPGRRACIYAQMGLCNPCPTDIENENDFKIKNEKRVLYQKNIRHIKKFLGGNLKDIKKSLTHEMQEKVKSERFEEALIIKNRIQAIEYITAPKNPVVKFLENPNFSEDLKQQEGMSLNKLLSDYFNIKNLSRIECFDIAHLSGTYPTASIVTFVNGTPDKSLYRHFKIRQGKSRDDISSLAEVAKRRIKHLYDWGKPDLIIVDGGKGQVNVFNKEFEKFDIPVVGIAKKTESLVIPQTNSGIKTYVLIRMHQSPALNLIQRLRNEAHRFARRLHHKLLGNALF